jgi:hypothetical protein
LSGLQVFTFLTGLEPVVSLDHIAGGHGGTWEDDGN